MFLPQEYPCEKTRQAEKTVSQQRGWSPPESFRCSSIRLTRADISAGAERHPASGTPYSFEASVAVAAEERDAIAGLNIQLGAELPQDGWRVSELRVIKLS